MGSSISTSKSRPLSQGDDDSLRNLSSSKNEKCKYKNHIISSDEKTAIWIKDHYHDYMNIVRFDRNIPCRTARRHRPTGFHPEYLKKSSCTPDSENTSLSSSIQQHDSKNIEKHILTPDSKANEQIFLQKDSIGKYYLSNTTGKTTYLSDLKSEKEAIKWVVDKFLGCNLNKPIEFMIKNGTFNPNDSTFKEPMIHLAISYLQKELLQFLLNGEYVDINALNSEGDTPLVASVLLYPEKGILEIIDLLLKYKPDLTIKDRYGKTALENANCFAKSAEITKRLLAHHTFPNEIPESPVIKDAMTERKSRNPEKSQPAHSV